MSGDDDDRRDENEFLPERRPTRAPLPFKEPDSIKLVVAPDAPSTKLVVDAPAVRPNLTAQDVDQAIEASKGSPGTSTEYTTTNALKKGLAGERLAAEALNAQGHQILDYKPDIHGTNQGGIDIVTMKDGELYLIDNKAYATARDVASVSALDQNFDRNLADVRAKFAEYADDQNRSEDERKLYTEAIEAIDEKNYHRAVTTAAIAPDGAHSTGISDALRERGIIFLPLEPPDSSGGSPNPGAGVATRTTDDESASADGTSEDRDIPTATDRQDQKFGDGGEVGELAVDTEQDDEGRSWEAELPEPGIFAGDAAPQLAVDDEDAGSADAWNEPIGGRARGGSLDPANKTLELAVDAEQGDDGRRWDGGMPDAEDPAPGVSGDVEGGDVGPEVAPVDISPIFGPPPVN